MIPTFPALALINMQTDPELVTIMGMEAKNHVNAHYLSERICWLCLVGAQIFWFLAYLYLD